jgi:hypothetical protein
LTQQQAGRKLKLMQRKGYPDLFIAQPNKKYHGLYIELKENKDKVIGKKGKMLGNKYLREQIEMMELLQDKGYCCFFCWDIKQFVDILNDYLNDRIDNNSLIY